LVESKKKEKKTIKNTVKENETIVIGPPSIPEVPKEKDCQFAPNYTVSIRIGFFKFRILSLVNLYFQ